jgi:hypothetical protein
MVTLIVLRYNVVMKHGDFFIDLVDDKGRSVGKKLRRQVDKYSDLFNGVYVLMITPRGELVLGSITEREDLPNIYAHKLGVTVAAIRRSDETPVQAARRALKRELLMNKAEVHLLGEQLVEMVDHRRVYLSAFYLVCEPPSAYSTVDIDGLSPIYADRFREALTANPDRFAPTLQSLWEHYESDLPIS